ncbi:DUF938 domain-containing protein [Qipengyuania aurantiaca]|uniref:DUF938 domain-containing protein n=1 Tax=Qipengyuania aurantiaca TaxID=2867233 RepID=A0ABX8ZPH1_9SPHN|nr:DUF938 domain-containing protein [Qipengyuania aurantiaca]QZD89073.1 DUF938 domain-containing protein [Qipengyuania aurantiaca]
MKRHAPATARNSEPLAEVLEKELPDCGLVLEIASGTGEHAIFMARRFPMLRWQPSDQDASALESIAAWAGEAGLANLQEPIELDASGEAWPIDAADAILCVNMIHISPWSATEGLFRGAATLLDKGAPLILYGPYLEEGTETAASNLSFDASLKARDTAWGLRLLEAVDELAASNGFTRSARHKMPANNLTIVFRRT